MTIINTILIYFGTVFIILLLFALGYAIHAAIKNAIRQRKVKKEIFMRCLLNEQLYEIKVEISDLRKELLVIYDEVTKNDRS